MAIDRKENGFLQDGLTDSVTCRQKGRVRELSYPSISCVNEQVMGVPGCTERERDIQLGRFAHPSDETQELCFEQIVGLFKKTMY